MIMMELPVADCLKEHYKKNNATFTDSERATIFWNSDLPLPQKLAALREIMDTTEDSVLRTQIENRLALEAEEERMFMLRDSDYVHTVFLDDDKEADSIFASVDAAIAYGRENCRKMYRVRKEILEDRLEDGADVGDDADDVDEEEDGPGILLGGEAEFQQDGAMLSCNCWSSGEPRFTIINGLEPEGFEEAYVPVLNPFEYGDIVRVMGDTRLAVVVTSQEHWNAQVEREASSGIGPLNYYTNMLTVEFLSPEGEFTHGHPNILRLEKVESWEDEDEWNLLTSLGELMKGKGWAEPVFACYLTNRHKRERGWSNLWTGKN